MLRKLIRDKNKHSTRDRMKKKLADLSNLKVRFAKTKYHSAVEEFLHQEHKNYLIRQLPSSSGLNVKWYSLYQKKKPWKQAIENAR